MMPPSAGGGTVAHRIEGFYLVPIPARSAVYSAKTAPLRFRLNQDIRLCRRVGECPTTTENFKIEYS